MFKLTNFYNYIDFDAGKRMAILKPIIEITTLSGVSSLLQIGQMVESDQKIVLWFSTKRTG